MTLLDFFKKTLFRQKKTLPAAKNILSNDKHHVIGQDIEAGSKFTDLVALNEPFFNDKNYLMITVQCRCGRIYNTRAYELIKGRTKRCRSCAASLSYEERYKKYGKSGRRLLKKEENKKAKTAESKDK